MLITNPSMESNTTADSTQQTISYEKASFNNSYQYDFSQWVNDRLVYPSQAKADKAEGCVYVLFSVDKTGRVTNIKVEKSINAYLDKEAIRVVSLSPRWKPAKVNGEPTETTYRMGINFKLS